jgi:hypothetical protein
VVLLLAVNAGLALLVQLAAPAQPHLTDRNDYDYNSTQPLTAYCPNTIYCYRILVPMVLNRIPADPELRWRSLQWLAHTATGTVVASVVAPFGSPFVASILAQTSFGFAYTAYDPYTPDPVVFLVAALLLYCWSIDRVFAATLMVTVLVLAKETVALLATIPAIAVLFANDRTQRWRWFVPAALAWTALLSFHWYMDTYGGWGFGRLSSADWRTGSWFGIWWRSNSLPYKALMIFAPFGFGWAFAALGFRHAPPFLRQLAIAAAAPIAALAFVQTPERALGNAFFVVVPLAAIFLARIPAAPAWAAAITNGLVTARLGLSSPVLPSASILLVPAALSAIWAVSAYRRESHLRQGHGG